MRPGPSRTPAFHPRLGPGIPARTTRAGVVRETRHSRRDAGIQRQGRQSRSSPQGRRFHPVPSVLEGDSHFSAVRPLPPVRRLGPGILPGRREPNVGMKNSSLRGRAVLGRCSRRGSTSSIPGVVAATVRLPEVSQAGVQAPYAGPEAATHGCSSLHRGQGAAPTGCAGPAEAWRSSPSVKRSFLVQSNRGGHLNTRSHPKPPS
jgi:hypothetical protein